MPVLKLSWKGYSLDLPYTIRHFYLTHEIRPGKTLYQILFEHLVEGKQVSARELARKFKTEDNFLSPAAVRFLIKKIERAIEKSPDPKLKKMLFHRLPAGGASPVLSRNSAEVRYTLTQRVIIDRTVKKLYRGRKNPARAQVIKACMDALRREGLDANVSLSKGAITQSKKRVGVPLGQIFGINLKRKRV